MFNIFKKSNLNKQTRKKLKKNKTKIKELNKGNNIPIFLKNKISSISFIYIYIYKRLPKIHVPTNMYQ